VVLHLRDKSTNDKQQRQHFDNSAVADMRVIEVIIDVGYRSKELCGFFLLTPAIGFQVVRRPDGDLRMVN